MIKYFSDLAANERTYLAWIRTAIAMMTFGFLVEKFELFLRVISAQLHLQEHNIVSSRGIEAIGIMMMSVAVIVIIGSTIRYLIQRKSILTESNMEGAPSVIGLILSLFLIVVSLFLIGYIWLRLLY